MYSRNHLCLIDFMGGRAILRYSVFDNFFGGETVT